MLHKGNLALLSISLCTALLVGCGGDGATGPQGPAGRPGDPGTPGVGGDPSINGVTPGKVFAERTIDVTISGFSTNWTDAAKVDFGAGINVASKIVASQTAIVATIEVTDAAALGKRDVTVTEGSSTVTYKGAFDIQSPLDVATLAGTPAQGSILLAHVAQKDLSTPFDTTTTGDGFFEPIEYVNLAVNTASGVNGSVSSADLFSADLLILTDVKAAAGSVDIGIDSGPPGDTITSTAKDSFTLDARTPVDLMADVEGKGAIKMPFDTLLFAYKPSAMGKILKIEAAASSADGTPGVAVLPASGSFADLITFDAAPTVIASEPTYYFVYWDNTGVSGYDGSITVKEENVDEVEPNNACNMSQKVAALPADLKNASLADKDDVDWYEINVTAADVGKQIHVVTSPGDAQTDTIVDVFSDDCKTSLGGPSDDSDYHEDYLFDPIPAAGTYYVQVAASPFGYSGALYNLSITLE